MDIDSTTTEKVDSDSELNSAPPAKKQKTQVIDPIKTLLGKAQLFLNPDFIYYYKVRQSNTAFLELLWRILDVPHLEC